MYPHRELIRLAMHKGALRRRITMQRMQCAEAAAHLAQPFGWLDRVVAFWRKLSSDASVAAVPVGLLAVSAIFPRVKMLRPLLQWGPFLFRVVGQVRAAVTRRRSS